MTKTTAKDVGGTKLAMVYAPNGERGLESHMMREKGDRFELFGFVWDLDVE
jgi:hypothetical protein